MEALEQICFEITGVALLNLVIAISIWSVFVIIANKVELKEASGSEE